MSDSTSSAHLLVLIHGMWGSPSNLASMHRIIEQRINESSKDSNGAGLHVMLSETNKDESTYDGIDWGGERGATEVSELPYVDDIFPSKRCRTDLSRKGEIRKAG
jgi:Putative serine esterase (DUF676)